MSKNKSKKKQKEARYAQKKARYSQKLIDRIDGMTVLVKKGEVDVEYVDYVNGRTVFYVGYEVDGTAEYHPETKRWTAEYSHRFSDQVHYADDLSLDEVIKSIRVASIIFDYLGDAPLADCRVRGENTMGVCGHGATWVELDWAMAMDAALAVKENGDEGGDEEVLQRRLAVVAAKHRPETFSPQDYAKMYPLVVEHIKEEQRVVAEARADSVEEMSTIEFHAKLDAIMEEEGV